MQEEVEELINGFVFINRLRIPLSFCVEGTSVDELKNQILEGLVGGI